MSNDVEFWLRVNLVLLAVVAGAAIGAWVGKR